MADPISRRSTEIERYARGERPNNPRAARDLVRQAVDAAQWAGDLDAAVLLASEIAANALIHAGSMGEIHVSIENARLRVELEDFGGGSPRICEADRTATSGRGMAIVDQLSDAWGVLGEGATGKRVWFEIDAS